MKTPAIFCIDDQREILAALRRDLATFEEVFEFIDCESAGEAAEEMTAIEAKGGHVMLLICDHVMPEKNGIDFLSEVNDDIRFKHTRKLLLTGLATHQDTILAINRADIDYYIEKPWEKDRLAKAVRTQMTEYILRSGIPYQSFHRHLDKQKVYQSLRNRT